MNENIKKYPITYKGEEYEIRIEEEKEFMFSHYCYIDKVNIYKTTLYNYCFLGIYPIKTKIKYNKVYSIGLDDLKRQKMIKDIKDSEEYYIEIFKKAFYNYIKPIETINKQLAALKEWDGVIE